MFEVIKKKPTKYTYYLLRQLVALTQGCYLTILYKVRGQLGRNGFFFWSTVDSWCCSLQQNGKTACALWSVEDFDVFYLLLTVLFWSRQELWFDTWEDDTVIVTHFLQPGKRLSSLALAYVNSWNSHNYPTGSYAVIIMTYKQGKQGIKELDNLPKVTPQSW